MTQLREMEYSDDPASAWVRALWFISLDHLKCFSLRLTQKISKLGRIEISWRLLNLSAVTPVLVTVVNNLSSHSHIIWPPTMDQLDNQ